MQSGPYQPLHLVLHGSILALLYHSHMQSCAIVLCCCVTDYDLLSSVSQLKPGYIKPDPQGPGPGPGLLQSNIASFWSRNIFWTGLGPRVASALLFLFISYKPHQPQKKENN